jgi:hypothetical protein
MRIHIQIECNKKIQISKVNNFTHVHKKKFNEYKL